MANECVECTLTKIEALMLSECLHKIKANSCVRFGFDKYPIVKEKRR